MRRAASFSSSLATCSASLARSIASSVNVATSSAGVPLVREVFVFCAGGRVGGRGALLLEDAGSGISSVSAS